MNLKAINAKEIRSEVFDLLARDEEAVSAFKSVRDQVLFTNKRIIVINVQGITGKKVSYLSYPYSKVQYFGVETAGILDIDSELILLSGNGACLTFDFKTNVDIQRLCALISNYVF